MLIIFYRSNDASPSETVSSPQDENKAGGGWWDSWLSSAKTKVNNNDLSYKVPFSSPLLFSKQAFFKSIYKTSFLAFSQGVFRIKSCLFQVIFGVEQWFVHRHFLKIIILYYFLESRSFGFNPCA